MSTTTGKGYQYPANSDAVTVYPTLAQNNALLEDARPGVSVVTTTQMNAYAGSDLWDGRIVWNTTLAKLMKYDVATVSWISAVSSISPATTVVGPDAFGAAAVVGVSALYARADHDHGLPSIAAYATTASVAATLASYALLASPTFTGTPLAPTAATATNNTQIATTAYVQANLAYYATTAAVAATFASYSTTAAINATLASYALLASPVFTGAPLAPTAAAGTNTTQIATTQFVTASFAPIASPTFTGTPAAPTAAPGTNTTQLANTAFVTAAIAAAPTGATTLIASQVLGTAAASVTFSSIPGTYHHLLVVAIARSSYGTYNDMYVVQVNGDTGNNYDTVYFSGYPGSSSIQRTTGPSWPAAATGSMPIPGSFTTANYVGRLRLEFPAYASTTFYKTMGYEAECPDDVDASSYSYMARGGGTWKNTAAITSIKFSINSGGNFIAGSSFYLYGVN